LLKLNASDNPSSPLFAANREASLSVHQDGLPLGARSDLAPLQSQQSRDAKMVGLFGSKGRKKSRRVEMGRSFSASILSNPIMEGILPRDSLGMNKRMSVDALDEIPEDYGAEAEATASADGSDSSSVSAPPALSMFFFFVAFHIPAKQSKHVPMFNCHRLQRVGLKRAHPRASYPSCRSSSLTG
jgi:hypothetical protein